MKISFTIMIPTKRNSSKPFRVGFTKKTRGLLCLLSSEPTSILKLLCPVVWTVLPCKLEVDVGSGCSGCWVTGQAWNCHHGLRKIWDGWFWLSRRKECILRERNSVRSTHLLTCNREEVRLHRTMASMGSKPAVWESVPESSTDPDLRVQWAQPLMPPCLERALL